MKNFIRKLSINLSILFVTITLFMLIAEAATRIHYKYFSEKNISSSKNSYDTLPRLEGYTIEKKKGTYRVLVLGDSIAYGQGVKRDETFSKRLETLLSQESSGKKNEVINTGLMGIDTTQEFAILLNKGPNPGKNPKLADEGYQGLAYKPDLIILQYTVSNDATYYDWSDPDFERIYMPHRWRKDEVRRYNYGDYALPLPENIDRWLTKNSKFFLLFLKRYHSLLSKAGLRDEAGRIKAMYEPQRKGWQRTKFALNQIGKIARLKKIPAVLLIWGTNNDHNLKEVHELVGNVGKESGFYLLDLSEYIQWPKKDFSASITDGHPNAEAHNIAAKAIYNFLKELNLISTSDAPSLQGEAS